MIHTRFDALLSCLPAAPDYQWNWDALSASPLSSSFSAMEHTDQHPLWHGEGNVWLHTKLVCEALCSLTEFRMLTPRRQQILALAALLHDLGKPACTRLEDGILVAPGHGAAGAQQARCILWQEFGLCGTPDAVAMREAICLLIAHHTLPLHLLDRENPALLAMRLAASGELAPDFTLDMLFTLSQADVMGRIAADVPELLERLSLNRELAAESGCLHTPFSYPSACTLRAHLSGRNVWPHQPLFDDSFGEVILLCGLPGTGKDTFIRTHYPAHPVISLDDIRRSMGVDPADNQGRVVQAAREQARIYLRAKQPFIWNATSLTELLRQNQVSLFESYGAAVRILYLETEWMENLRRNAGREHAVPESVIGRMMARLSVPRRHEARCVQWRCV